MTASPTMKTQHTAGLSTSPAETAKTRVQLAEQTENTTVTGETITEKLAEIIRTRPGASLLVAAALGGIAAWIIKRRE